MEGKASEIISEFLSFLESSKIEYEDAYSDVGKEDSKVQTFLHDMEFASNKGERNKIATRLQQSAGTGEKQKTGCSCTKVYTAFLWTSRIRIF